MTDDYVKRTLQWIRYSPEPIFALFTVFMFASYLVAGFEITVIALLIIIVQQVTKP